ncbi:MAG TPA: glycerophosphodiester phosphodiesterase family protein [Thermoclostridium sp.]
MKYLEPSIRALREYRGKRPLVASHKGRNSGFVAENTANSFTLALREGADIIEADVSLTGDGKMILMHGPNLDRYTDGKGPIIDHTLDEIMQLHLRTDNGYNNDCQILTLDEFLKKFKNVCIINLDRCFDFLPEAWQCVKQHEMTDQVLMKSPRELDKVFQWLEKSNFEPQFMPIINNDEDALDFVLDTARYYPYPAVELVFKDDSHRMVSKEVIDSFHEMGIKVWINSLTLSFPLCGYHDDMCSLFDDPDKGWGWLCDHGADVIQTDFVRELNEYLDKRYRVD